MRTSRTFTITSSSNVIHAKQRGTCCTHRSRRRHGAAPALSSGLGGGQELVVQGVGVDALLGGLQKGLSLCSSDAEAQGRVVHPIRHRLERRDVSI